MNFRTFYYNNLWGIFMKEIRIKVNGEMKVIGKYDPEKNIFYYPKSYARHFFSKKRCWAIDTRILKYFAERESMIVLIVTDKKQTFKVSAKYWLEKGKMEDYGHLEQHFLEEAKFDLLSGRK